jgi:hypothetical protein
MTMQHDRDELPLLELQLDGRRYLVWRKRPMLVASTPDPDPVIPAPEPTVPAPPSPQPAEPLPGQPPPVPPGPPADPMPAPIAA